MFCNYCRSKLVIIAELNWNEIYSELPDELLNYGGSSSGGPVSGAPVSTPNPAILNGSKDYQRQQYETIQKNKNLSQILSCPVPGPVMTSGPAPPNMSRFRGPVQHPAALQQQHHQFTMQAGGMGGVRAMTGAGYNPNMNCYRNFNNGGHMGGGQMVPSSVGMGMSRFSGCPPPNYPHQMNAGFGTNRFPVNGMTTNPYMAVPTQNGYCIDGFDPAASGQMMAGVRSVLPNAAGMMVPNHPMNRFPVSTSMGGDMLPNNVPSVHPVTSAALNQATSERSNNAPLSSNDSSMASTLESGLSKDSETTGTIQHRVNRQ